MVASGLRAQLRANDAYLSVCLVTDNEFEAPKAIRYDSVVSSTPINLTPSALLLKRVAIASELLQTNFFLRFGLLAAEDGGIVRDLDVDGEVVPFVTTPTRVYKAKELADVVPVGHDVDRGDVERWMRYVQRAEERFEGAVWVSRGVTSNVDMSSVLF